MKNELRFVFDTNVLVSAVLFHSSVPGIVFARSLESGTILISQSLIEELNNVLQRKKFDRYVTREERERFLEALIRESELVEITDVIRACRDPKDDHFLELAIDGKASFLVTGDSDLLVLNPFRGVQVITPAELLELLDAKP